MLYDIRAWWTDLLWGGRGEESPIEYARWRISVRVGTLSLRLLRVRCWLVGHEVVHGGRWTNEPNYCPRCFIDWPSEHTTLPMLLNKGYCWLVERDWRWFDRLDEWFFNHVPRKWWPSWWEY